MQRYLVGGAVRDGLLGLPVVERDWLMVGATPEALHAEGYIPVGKDFPVFLHPQTKEECALARTERKSGRGYHGFQFYTGADVSVEEDLIRRDLTINAMAQAEDGTLIDPFGGQKDLQSKTIRHVSAAFAEDPVRVLRLARFAARWAPLGFTVAPETLALCQRMAADGELDHLVPERVWKETERALRAVHNPETPAGYRPRVFFETLHSAGALSVLFPELHALYGVPQRADYHPEVDTGVHIMMCIDAASRHGFSVPVHVAALCHDYGKALTPHAEWPSHKQHEARGVPLVKSFCERLRLPKDCSEVACIHTAVHLKIHSALELRASTLLELLETCQALRKPAIFEQILQASFCDAQGRLNFENCQYPQVDYLKAAAQAMMTVTAAEVMRDGFSGAAIGPEQHRRRARAIEQWKAAQPLKSHQQQ